MKTTYLIVGCLLAGFVALGMLAGTPGGAVADEGGIVFSHASHKDKGECSTCHEAAASGAATDNLLPKPEVCATCHEAKDVRTYWSLKDDAPLDVVYLKPEDRQLYFSHSAHTGTLKLACESCHGGILEDGGSGMPGMQACNRCHNDAGIAPDIIAASESAGDETITGNRCELCHTTLAGLKPDYHLSAGFIKFHGKFAADGDAERYCAGCHSPSFCQECHSPTNDVPAGTAKDKFYLSAWPRGEKIDDGRLTTVQTVHSLTYRYTHGFDARAQSSRCQTCHDPETFCTPCHRNGYDGNGARIIPQSHALAGFVTLGGSRAMNRHAKLAAMDMESCVTCHEVDGGDPVCAKCHSTGLVKGGDHD